MSIAFLSAAGLSAALFAQQLSLAPTPPAPRSDWPGARLHLLEESLRIPFGEDWGGEADYFLRFNRLDLGGFVRAWSQAVCDRPDCAGRSVQAGAAIRVKVAPALDVGVEVGALRDGTTQRTQPVVMPRLRLKF
jgi:hypothetical protein